MSKFLKRRWAWSLLAACLIGSVIVVLPALVQLGQESKRGKVLQAERSAAHLLIRSQELERAQWEMNNSLIALFKKQQTGTRPCDPGDDAFDLDLWKAYLRDLKEADGIPDQELKILRRDIHLMSLPDPARI
jgi:hypothetical protein